MPAAATANRPVAPPAGPAYGLRRIDRVRVLIGNGRPVAEVTGIAHRYPCTFQVSMATALEMADAGVPLLIEHRGDRACDRSR